MTEVEERIAADGREAMSDDDERHQLRDVVWVAYYSDWSGFRLFASEIEALRYAVEHDMKVLSGTLPMDPREASR